MKYINRIAAVTCIPVEAIPTIQYLNKVIFEQFAINDDEINSLIFLFYNIWGATLCFDIHPPDVFTQHPNPY